MLLSNKSLVGLGGARAASEIRCLISCTFAFSQTGGVVVLVLALTVVHAAIDRLFDASK